MIGKTLGKYRIVKPLGKGGMAEVYKAYQPSLDRYVALKLIRASTADDPEYLVRFQREAKSAAALHHPNIVQVYDYDVDAETGQPYIVMEFVEGESLATWLERREAASSPLTLAEIDHIYAGVCGALAYAHQHGVVHRDVKLGNIMRDDGGRLVLTDFGLAKLVTGPSVTSTGISIGTPDYMSPEQVMAKHVDARADLYALGIILYRVLTGHMPYVAETPMGVMIRHYSDPVPDPRRVKPDLPLSLARLTIKAIAKSPDERFQTADEFLAELRRAIARTTAPLPAIPAPGPAEPEWSTDILRQLLNEAFDDDELSALCFDHFRIVYDRFGDGMGKDDKIQTLLEHCVRRNLVGALLERIKERNPAQYARFAPHVRGLIPTPTSVTSVESLPVEMQPSPTPPSGPTTPTGEQVSAAPFQAPADIPWFVGREEELADIHAALTRSSGNNIYCLAGMGGIGKTTFAIRLAHQLRAQFTDGVLWANAATSEPMAILDSWARAFQCDFSGLPDLDSRAAALRGVLADKQILIILDDVRSTDLAQPLLPGGTCCAVLITTRDMELAEALKGNVYQLSALTPTESRQLLSGVLGEERVKAEESLADEIGRLLGHLPLAVEIAAQRLASRRRWRLADLAERLRDEHSRLHELRISNHEVRTSFAVSWDGLSEPLRRAFALIGVLEGRTFTTPAFAAVAELDQRAAEDSLYALVSLSLVGLEGEVHYRQHPLLADFARERLGQDEAAYTRLARYFLEYAQKHQRDYVELEKEWNNLWAGIQIAHQQKMWQVVLDYTQALKDAWFARGHYTDARKVYAWACEAARTIENRQALADARLHWGQACIEQGDYAEAQDHLSSGMQLCSEIDDQAGVARAQHHLGRIASEQANYDMAQQLLVASQHIREQLGDTVGVAETLYRQANISFYRSAYDVAEQLGEQALKMQQATGDKVGSIRTLGLLADIALQQGQPDVTEKHCGHALELCEETDEEVELAITLFTLSNARRMQGDLVSAQAHAEKSLAMLKYTGDRKAQARVLYKLSQVSADRHDYAYAMQNGMKSLALCKDLNDTWGSVYVLRHLGDVMHALGQVDRAREMWSEGLRIAEVVEHPLRGKLEQLLAPQSFS